VLVPTPKTLVLSCVFSALLSLPVDAHAERINASAMIIENTYLFFIKFPPYPVKLACYARGFIILNSMER